MTQAGIFLLTVFFLLTGCDELQQVSNSKHGAYEASMTVLRDGFAVAWYDDRDGNPEIYMRLLDALGRPRSREYRLTNDPEFSYEPDIAATANGDLAIGWYERLTNGDLRARLAVFTESGESRWTKVISSPMSNGRNVVVRLTENGLFAAWIEDDEVLAQWWNLDGQPSTSPRRLAPAGKTTWDLNATIDVEGRAWVVFDAKAGTRADELYLARTSKTDMELMRLTADDGFASKYPNLAFDGDRAALAWYDERDGNQEVYIFVGSPGELRENLERRARRVTNTPGESLGAYVAWNKGRAGLVWCDRTPGQHEIYFEDFDRTGRPLHEPQRLTHTRTDSLIPAIKAVANAFALVWNEYAAKGPGHTTGARSEIVFGFVRE
jgi:hypothetical protein